MSKDSDLLDDVVARLGRARERLGRARERLGPDVYRADARAALNAVAVRDEAERRAGVDRRSGGDSAIPASNSAGENRAIPASLMTYNQVVAVYLMRPEGGVRRGN